MKKQEKKSNPKESGYHTGSIILWIVLGAIIVFAVYSVMEEEINKAKWAAFDPTQISSDPIQINLQSAETILLSSNGIKFEAIPKAKYKVSALVASKHNYADEESVFAPADVVLLWGDLANSSYEDYLHVTQGNRRYFFRYDGSSPFSVSFMEEHSANVHLVPANENIRKGIDFIEKNTVIYIEGYLIDVKKNNNLFIKTSLSRSDLGPGACEIVFIQELTVNSKTYK